jgi:Protein of unknown function (DUF2793)
MTDISDRFHLPLLASGQAQKEVTHNEALALLDILVQSVVQAVAPAGVPTVPAAGQSWIVGPSPSGVWSGQAGNLASWTSGGWRFVVPIEGMSLWSIADSAYVRHEGGAWVIGIVKAISLKIGENQVVGSRQAAITSPTGGAVVDSEARAAINGILTAIRSHGLIQP